MANRKQIDLLIPYEDFKKALIDGIVEMWELAEHFRVSPQFIKKAVERYLTSNN